jgi:transcriptional regulator with XRE-family HTH domain
MTESPDVPPEGTLIKRALKTARLSQREGARRAGISETRWRQLVSGYQTVGGAKVAVRSPDETLARMARAAGVTAEQLEAAGRAEAAAVLRDVAPERAGDAHEGANHASAAGGSHSRVDERWHMLEAVLRQAGVGLNAAEYDTLAGRINAFLAQSPQWRAQGTAHAPEAAPAPEPGGRTT